MNCIFLILASSYVYMDTNNRNKSLIRMEMLYVITSFGDFDPIWTIQKEVSFLTRGAVYADCYFGRCPCTYLFRSCLHGWAKIILAVLVCLTFQKGKLMLYSCLLSCELYHLPWWFGHFHYYCEWRVTTGASCFSLLKRALQLVCSVAFEHLKMGDHV